MPQKAVFLTHNEKELKMSEQENIFVVKGNEHTEEFSKSEKLTDKEKAIEKIVDDTLVMEALIVLDLDETKVKAIKDWSQRQIDENFALRNLTVKRILAKFKDYKSPKEVKKLVEAEREKELKEVEKRIWSNRFTDDYGDSYFWLKDGWEAHLKEKT